MGSATRLTLSLTVLVLAAACLDSLGGPAGDTLPLGTWGGENAGMLVDDSGAHVHIGCTVGDIEGAIPLDAAGRFEVEGVYNLYAFPIDRGTRSPARFTGQAGNAALILTVTVSDTVSDSTVVLGPVKLSYGREPGMGPCPICRWPRHAGGVSASPPPPAPRPALGPGSRFRPANGPTPP